MAEIETRKYYKVEYHSLNLQSFKDKMKRDLKFKKETAMKA